MSVTRTWTDWQRARDARIPFLASGPVLQTLAGCRARIKRLTVGELFLLTSHYDCDIGTLHRRLWSPPGKRKEHERR